ncbi:sugar transferase [Cryomorphaceae bacterium]|nr:sugar transferase [Cryomorphaceae bacterium]
MNRPLHRLKYLFFDVLSAGGAWTLFFVYRKTVIESAKFGIRVPLDYDAKFYASLVAIILFWIGMYAASGYYRDIYRKSRLQELGQTMFYSIFGTVIIFFVLILDDTIVSYRSYYSSFFTLLGLHFGLTYLPRFFLTTHTARRIHRREIGFPTLLIGSNENAVILYLELEGARKSSGNSFVGFVSVENNIEFLASKELNHLGVYTELPEIIEKYEVEEVIIALESTEHSRIEEILNLLEAAPVVIKMIPDTYDILSGKVRMQSIFGTPLIEIQHELMPLWQFTIKRALDITLSILFMLLLSPVFLVTAVMTAFSSPGPIFYKQERVGLNRKPFYIIKFRSMFQDAEKAGPQLSSEQDPRITKWGRIMRKFRLDELPQLWNVLIGDMSFVGPRPERQFYIEQIEQEAPHYRHLHRVKPGITSWGMVKYGYAENVEEMIQRMKYDIIYIENMSLFIDIKILIYTILIVLQGRGK